MTTDDDGADRSGERARMRDVDHGGPAGSDLGGVWARGAARERTDGAVSDAGAVSEDVDR